MGTLHDNTDKQESFFKEKGEIAFIDFEEEKSVCSYIPNEEDPIIISYPFALVDGKPQSVFVGDVASDSITINNTTEEAVDLWGVHIYASNPEDTFTISLMEPPSANSDEETIRNFIEFFTLEDRMLPPGENLTVWLSCKPKEIGMHTTVVQFDVGDDRIERVVFLLAEDKVSRSLAAGKPYVKGRKKEKFVVRDYVVGSRPAPKREHVYKNRLLRYEIPEDIRELLESNQIPDTIQVGLMPNNYAHYFKTLVMMEEIQLEENMRNYDLENVNMRKNGNQFLSLLVPGLAERRPSLVHGDYVFAKLSANENGTIFQGFIHRVEADEVFLKFKPEFHSSHRDDNLYHVHFRFNRINMRRLYQAIEATENLEREFLFPSEYSRRCIKAPHIVPVCGFLNEEQMCSIEKILGCKGAPPYLIYGPPGTGKTNTVVEAILQVFKTRKASRILVCAPSNSAADYILEKVLNGKTVECPEKEIFRLNAPSRPYEDISPEIIQFSCVDEEEHIFSCPQLSVLKRFRIVISTFMSASLLYGEGVKRGHFSHIFLDEACQASEPETMIPISNLCKRDTVVVLAGDPRQLGPVIHSRVAEAYELGKSYMERLFECEMYCCGNESFVTKLVRNYRCHPEILSLPSKMFYNGELIASKDNTSFFISTLDFLPNREFPILFLGIQGCDEREGSNPSWFNRIEASKVLEVTMKLKAGGNIREEDIGIITPYRQQVLKIKAALESLDMSGIKVGSVEQFQGQEREVIIVSTVRSTIKHNEFDRIHCLGFLSNQRRFNVAITRAISLLIVIGNPHIICKDPYWNKLLWHCVDNSSYQGCLPPERQSSNFYCEEESVLPTENVDWREPDSDIPPPIADETEWSDGGN